MQQDLSHRRGLLVTFEGGEGSGKSTQLAALAARVYETGREVVAAREPGGTSLGEALRPLTRKPGMTQRIYAALTGDSTWSGIEARAELFLYEAARAQLVSELVQPGLERGAVVMLDRFTDSTLTYQGYGRGLDLDSIAAVNAIAARNLTPDRTFLLDLDVEIGLARKRGEVGRDAIGGENRAFHERVRAGYRKMAAAEPQRWVILDATLAADALGEQIWEIVQPLL